MTIKKTDEKTDEKKATFAEHVADTHRKTERPGAVVTGDNVSGDVVAKEQETTDAAEEEKSEAGEDS